MSALTIHIGLVGHLNLVAGGWVCGLVVMVVAWVGGWVGEWVGTWWLGV